jgi:hypothetical protein
MKPATWIVVCLPVLALVAVPAVAQDKTAAVTLDTARALFTRADADGNGQLSASEATTLGFDARSMSSSDSDANQSLSRDEFIVGYHQFLVHQAKPVAADLEAESTRLQALRRAQRSEELKQGRQVGTAGANQPAPSDARQGPRGPSQRTGAESPAAVPSRPAPETGAATPSAAGPGAARRVALAGGDVQQTREEKLRAIQETLNRRLRNGELSDPEAKAAYERMRQRIDNALGLRPEVAPAAAPDGSAAASADAQKSREEQLLAIQESLNKRLRNADLSQREALGAYARVDHRIDNALGVTPTDPAHPAGDAAPAAESPRPALTPEEAETLRQRVLDAQLALTRRVRNGQVDPATAAAAQADLRRRLERAVSNGVPQAGTETPAAPAAERARRSAGDPAASPPSPPPARPRGSDGGSGADASSGGSRPRGS